MAHVLSCNILILWGGEGETGSKYTQKESRSVLVCAHT